MKIKMVRVTYGELRSEGHPTYGNKRHEVTFEATVENDDDPRFVMLALHQRAKVSVEEMFSGRKMDPPKSFGFDPEEDCGLAQAGEEGR